MLKLRLILLFSLLAGSSLLADPIAPPPKELVESLHLSPFYQKHLSIEGFPILASAKVSDYALREAEYLLQKTIGHRPDILRALAENHVRLVIMAPTEMTTDVPEHSDMKPALFWNRRARGLGSTKERPAVSCGEENLLCLQGDPYVKENILIHEFAHAIHEMGLSKVDPTFDGRLKATYEAAMKAGLWKGTYSTNNKQEYWAEGVQCWFDCAGSHDREHGDVDTREKLKAHDPALAKLIAEVYGDNPWRYKKPQQRDEAGRAHLAGFDVTKAPRFVWPASAPAIESQGTDLAWIAPDKIPSASSGGGKATTIVFVNQRAKAVDVDWIGLDGSRKHYATVRPRLAHLMDTFSGHAWLISESGTPLGAVIATDQAGRAVISPDAGKVSAPPRETRNVSGWQVHISVALLHDEAARTAQSLELLKKMLDEIVRVVPSGAVAELQKVPLYFSPEYPASPPGAAFHPDAGWLRDNGRDPVMAQGVEFSNIRIFAAEQNRMPNFALHELAHAYHFRVLPHGFDNAEIKTAYEHAKASGKYDRVERWHGSGKPNTFERAYAMTNPMEYFAENTEAFFSRNDFFPFTREELKQTDPEMFALLAKLWGKQVEAATSSKP